MFCTNGCNVLIFFLFFSFSHKVVRPEFCCAVTVPLTGTTTNLLWMGSMCLLSVSFIMGVYKTCLHKMVSFFISDLFTFCEIYRVGKNNDKIKEKIIMKI